MSVIIYADSIKRAYLKIALFEVNSKKLLLGGWIIWVVQETMSTKRNISPFNFLFIDD